MRGDQLKRQRGGVRPGKMIGQPYKAADGTTVVDVLDTYSTVWRACKIMTLGGGARTFFHVAPNNPVDANKRSPAESGGDLLLSFTDGATPHPVVLGSLQSQLSLSRFSSADAPIPADAAAYPDTNHPLDAVAESEGARFVLSRDGRVLISTKQSEKLLELATAPGSHIWLSLGEDTTETADRLLLATPTRAKVDALIAKVNSLESALANLQNRLLISLAAVPPVPVPPEPAFVAWTKALAGVLGALVPTTESSTDDSLNASAVLISPTNEAEE